MADDIPLQDLEVEAWPPRRLGGQHVGVSSGVKVTHVPTGICAIVDGHRSGHRNRLIAIDMILGGLTSPHFR